LIADEFTRKAVNHILISQVGKHQLLKPNLVLGGFSAGGTLAISLAEYYFQTDSNSSVRGVFAIDPPLDFVRLYASAENKMRYQCSSLIRKEGEMMIDYFEHVVGSSPSSRPEQYLMLSPCSASDPRGGTKY
jgi:acetyl esterase/lipase